MKIRCIYNTGQALRPFEGKPLQKEELGRFGATGYTEYGEIEIGKEYLVMGMIMFESYLAYLIDDNNVISACPCQLFEILDNKVNPNWYYRLIDRDEEIYPYVQAIWGYFELCFDKTSYINLLIEQDESAMQLYYKKKQEIENGSSA